MIRIIFFFILTLSTQNSCGQGSEDRPSVEDPEFDEKISRTISFSVPTIGVHELKSIQHKVHIFDAREPEEYEVSHIRGAHYIGYNHFETSRLENIAKTDTIVLYCSIGYRSEKIGEQLKEMGYFNVYNLYGSIFEWVNQGNELVDEEGVPTKKVHTYNKSWSKWVDGRKAEKVW